MYLNLPTVYVIVLDFRTVSFCAMMKRLQRAWIFVSHSTKDIEDVRRLRNAIENLGGEPILFFLKCISVNDELDELLRREIEARQYFILCDSTHSRASTWVQQEVTHVRSLSGKTIEEIDLKWPWETQLESICRILKEATLFPSYARKDRHIVDPLISILKAQDFSLFDPFSPIAGELEISIREALDHSRYFLDFLSDHSLQSIFCRREAQYFLEDPANRPNYFPVVLEMTPNVAAHLRQMNCQAINYLSREADKFVLQLRALLYPK